MYLSKSFVFTVQSGANFTELPTPGPQSRCGGCWCYVALVVIFCDCMWECLTDRALGTGTPVLALTSHELYLGSF